MLHPITHKFLSEAKEYDRLRQLKVCQLRNSVKASGPASPSGNQGRSDLLRFLLLHAEERLREATIAFRARVCETPKVEG